MLKQKSISINDLQQEGHTGQILEIRKRYLQMTLLLKNPRGQKSLFI